MEMKKQLALAIAGLCLATTVTASQHKATDTTPAQDQKLYQSFFKKRFPGLPLQEFRNGVYAIDKVSRDSWEAIEEFPPYEPFVEDGKALWNKPFANGKSYASCFKDGSPAQRKHYPHWDASRKMVVTLELAINECREKNGEKPLKYEKGEMASLTAYMAYQSRGQKIDIKVPKDPDAIAAYNKGKEFYFTRRGQLNFSCAGCHFESAGQHVRTDVLSPALGHASSWPVYRSDWGEMGTLHRRFQGCNEQVRAKAFPAQSEEYRNLEYFLTHMGNGIEFHGPSSRK
jgi:sulfur-oxidizing protein SoxA